MRGLYLNLIQTGGGQCENSPDLNRTMALRHANSAGSTATALYRNKISLRSRTSDAVWFALPLGADAA